MTTISSLTEQIREVVGNDSGLGFSLKIQFKDGGVILIKKSEASNEDGPADLVMTLRFADFLALGSGELNPMTAIMFGKMKFSDMKFAMLNQGKINAFMQRIPRQP
jgi:putative sterol carrier protein